MRQKWIVLGSAAVAAALVAGVTSERPGAAVRGESSIAAVVCSAGKHAAQAVRGAPQVTVNGKTRWKFLKAGDNIRTDKYGVVKLCLQAHRTQCVIGPRSTLRILPPRDSALMRFGFADVTCSQRGTVLTAKHDAGGYFLPLQPPEPTPGQRMSVGAATVGDPIFSIRIRSAERRIKLIRGAGVIDTASATSRAVVMDRNDEVVLNAAAVPNAPTEIKRLTNAEKKAIREVAKSLPKDSDHTAPTFGVRGPRQTSVRSATFVFENPSEPAVFSCAFDESKDFRLCANPFQVDRLSTGTHVLHVRATDTAGNTSPDARFEVTYDGSRIAFETFRNSNPEIYTTDPDGDNPRRLTTNAISDEHPDWSGDRSRIAFDRLIDGNLDIWTTDANGGGDQRVTIDGAPDRNPTWSPDGSTIAFERGSIGSREIFVIKLNGTGERQLTRDNTDDLDPAWSPDSKRIVFASAREGGLDIYVMNADGTGQTRLTIDETAEFGPSWSRLGKIAFHGARDGTATKNIYAMDPDGRNVTRLTRTEANDVNPSWAPDGLHIVFHSDRDKSSEDQLYVLDVLTGVQTQITPGAADPRDPNADLKRVSFVPDW